MIESNTNEEQLKELFGIDKETIERAKAAGINLSAITEQLLQSVIDEPKGTSRDDVVIAYEKLFNSMKILVKYELLIEVGSKTLDYLDDSKEEKEPFTVYLGHKERLEDIGIGVLYHPPDKDAYLRDSSVSAVLRFLYKPKKIIKNLVFALLEAAEKNKEKVKELELALRFVKALQTMAITTQN